MKLQEFSLRLEDGRVVKVLAYDREQAVRAWEYAHSGEKAAWGWRPGEKAARPRAQ